MRVLKQRGITAKPFVLQNTVRKFKARAGIDKLSESKDMAMRIEQNDGHEVFIRHSNLPAVLAKLRSTRNQE